MKKSISVKGKTHDRLKGFLDGEPMGPWVEKLINDALDAAEENRERDIRRMINEGIDTPFIRKPD